MDIAKLRRDPDAVKRTLIVKDDKVITTKTTYVYFPVRYAEKKLAEIASVIRTIGFFVTVVDDVYSVSKICADVSLRPSSISRKVIAEDEYYELQFDPGALLITNTNLIKNDTLPYYVFDEIVAKGHIPWYLNYEDMNKLFVSVRKYAGVNLGTQNTIHEMIAASISRLKSDKTKYYRYSVNDRKSFSAGDVSFVPFRSTVYGATNTTARLLGSYFDDNMISALANPSEKVEPVEALLRQ